MPHPDYRLAAVLYVDLVDFRSLLLNDERRALDLLAAYNGRVTSIAGEHHGSVIKTDGGALLLDFPSTADALRCAREMIPAIRDEGLRARAGMHLGDVYFRENDAVGDGVTIAQELCSRADPGAVVISADVHGQIGARLQPDELHPLGDVQLTTVERRLSLFQLFVPPGAAPVGEAGRGTSGSAGQASSAREAADDDSRVLRARVLDYIRRSGRRPAVRDLPSITGTGSLPDEATVRALVEEGLVRRPDAGERRSGGSRGGTAGPGASTAPGGASGERWDRPSGGSSNRSVGSWSPSRVVRGLKKILQSVGRSDEDLYQAYLSELRRKVNQERTGLAGHTTSYIGVNLMLFGLWFFTTGPVGFPWYLFPLLGWGIGYMSHRMGVAAREAELRQVEQMQQPTRDQLDLHRRLWKSRRGLRTELASSGMTAVLLGTINVITGVSFPWALIPIGFMTLGSVSHWRKSTMEQRQITEELNASGFVLSGRRAAPGLAAGAGPVAEARALRDALLEDLKSLDEAGAPLDTDVRGVLDTYMQQVEALSAALGEVDRLIADIPIAELERDRRRLSEQLESAADQRLAAEYRRSIEQIDAQRQAFSELKTEREMLSLRLETAVGALKQLRIDVGRARTTRGRTTDASIADLRSRSQELSQYLSDLRSAYEELEDG